MEIVSLNESTVCNKVPSSSITITSLSYETEFVGVCLSSMEERYVRFLCLLVALLQAPTKAYSLNRK